MCSPLCGEREGACGRHCIRFSHSQKSSAFIKKRRKPLACSSFLLFRKPLILSEAYMIQGRSPSFTFSAQRETHHFLRSKKHHAAFSGASRCRIKRQHIILRFAAPNGATNRSFITALPRETVMIKKKEKQHLKRITGKPYWSACSSCCTAGGTA